MMYTAYYEIEFRHRADAPWEFLVRIDVPYQWRVVKGRFLGFLSRQVAKPRNVKEAVRRAEIRAIKAAESRRRNSGVEDIRILRCDRRGWKLSKTPVWQNARFLE
jgi:hypothetical protein